MSNPEPNDSEQPLSPEAQEVINKARRRAGISMMILLVGFMAIAIAVVYRLSTLDTSAESRYALQSVALPAGSRVISTQVSDGTVTVTYETDAGTAIRLFDGETGALAREISITAE